MAAPTCFVPSVRATLLAAAGGCLAESLMSAARGASFFGNDGLSASQQALLFGVHLLTWLLIVTAASVTLTIAMGPSVPRRPWLSRPIRAAAMAGFVIAGVGYVFAWLFHFRTGMFPGVAVPRFVAANSQMLLLHFWQAERGDLLALGLVGILLAAITPAAIRRARRLNLAARERRPRVVFLLVVGIVWINSVWLSGLYCYAGLGGPRSAAAKSPTSADTSPSAAFELRSHVNPLVSIADELLLVEPPPSDGVIPGSALTPRVWHEPDRQAAPAAEKYRSVILIIVESLRADVIGLRHQGQPVTPCLDALAREGTFFPRCYSQSAHSDYADPAILSSLYPLRTARGHVYAAGSPWPKMPAYELLGRYGFSTAMYSSQNEAWGNMDVFYESPYLETFFDSRSYAGETFAFGEMRDWAASTGLAGKLDDAVTVREAVRWLTDPRRSGKPVFLSLNLQTSHYPYQRPDGGRGPFVPAVVPRYASLIDYAPDRAESIRNAYYNALRYVDAQIKVLVDELDRSGRRDRTVIAVTGDHGEAFGESGVMGHGGAPQEQTTRVGLIINCPGFIPRNVDPYLAESVDIVPTLVAAAGVDTHPAFQGIDLRAPARPDVNRRLAFIHCKTGIVGTDSVISGTGWRYSIDRLRETGTLQFRPRDLEPERDRSGERPGVAAVLRSILNEWRRRQLVYYGTQSYYSLYYPPRPPMIDDEMLSVLLGHADTKTSGP